jgi:CheY-like chemotaxis protein
VKTILVVDDEFGNAEALALMLEDEGYQVVCAYNGLDGLAKIAEQHPDVALVDFMMPVMDGAEMAAAMRASPDMRDIKVAMNSGLTEAAVRARFADYDAFLRKPFSFDDLLRVVRNLTGE